MRNERAQLVIWSAVLVVRQAVMTFLSCGCVRVHALACVCSQQTWRRLRVVNSRRVASLLPLI